MDKRNKLIKGEKIMFKICNYEENGLHFYSYVTEICSSGMVLIVENKRIYPPNGELEYKRDLKYKISKKEIYPSTELRMEILKGIERILKDLSIINDLNAEHLKRMIQFKLEYKHYGVAICSDQTCKD